MRGGVIIGWLGPRRTESRVLLVLLWSVETTGTGGIVFYWSHYGRLRPHGQG
jgi:hypothetical protein